MGIFNRLTGGRARGGSFDGGSKPSIPTVSGAAKGIATTPTTPNAITPSNPGNFSSIRTAPILTQPRYFNRQEAAAIRQMAKQRRQEVTSTKSAYKGLRQLERSDATVHVEHRKYETTVARGELKKKRADVGHAKALIGMSPAYLGLATGLDFASDRAHLQAQADQQQRIARHDQFKARLVGVR